MYLFLLLLGAAISIAGIGAVAYGAANIDYGFGHTLLVVGTTVAGSGFVVVALAVAVRELRRMADLMAARPADLREPAAAATAEPQAPRVEREERPVRKPEPDVRRDRPRFGVPDAAASAPSALTGDADAPPLPSTPRWTRTTAPEDAALRPSMLEGFGTSPLQRAKDEEGPSEAVSPPNAPLRPSGAFSDRLPGGSRHAAPAEGSAILKSGVVDGMAYTLYADGSIEAELPQGTMRFSSIEELRVHLEGG